MRAEKTQKEASIRRSKVRTLTIQPKIRFNRWSKNTAPEIKLYGNWLGELCFDYGKRVRITMVKQLLIIRLDGNE